MLDVDDVLGALGVHADAFEVAEAGCGAYAVLVASGAAGKGGHDAGRGDLADQVGVVGHVQVARGIDAQAVRETEFGVGACAFLVAHDAASGERAYGAGRGDFVDFVCVAVGDEQHARGVVDAKVVYRDEQRCAVDERTDDTGRRDLAYAVVARIGHINRSGGVDADAHEPEKLCAAARAVDIALIFPACKRVVTTPSGVIFLTL